MSRTLLGETLKEIRRKKKVTAETLAKKVGVDRTYISKIENTDYLPSYAVLRKIAKELDDPFFLELYLIEKLPEGPELWEDITTPRDIGHLVLFWLETGYEDEYITDKIIKSWKTHDRKSLPRERLLKAVQRFREATNELLRLEKTHPQKK